MKRITKIVLTALVVGGLMVPLLGCNSGSDEAELLESQVVTVQRGNLTVDITAVGNLALSLIDDLAFEIAGTVEEVLVETGDTVEEGQVLAKLDTSEWEEQIGALEDQLTIAKRQLTAAERQVTAAERQLAAVEYQLEIKKRNVTAKEKDVIQAEINLKQAHLNMYNLTPNVWDWEAAQKAEIEGMQIELAEARLEEAQQGIEDAQHDVEDAQYDVDDAQLAIEDAQLAVEDAQKDVEDAQEALDEAMNISPEIIAPFDGFITKVNVEGGDEVMKGTVAVTLADPAKFEAELMVSEMDIFQIRLEGEAWVQVDAMGGISLPAKVTHISPTATIQSGMVNYTVKVEIQSMEELAQQRQQAMQERQQAMQDITPGELPERLQQAIEEGRITQEQAEEMIKQMQSAQGAQQGQMPTAIPEDFQLREGLTVTVSILIDERTDVLLVPNGAITSRGGQAYVQVVLLDDTTEEQTIEERAIQTGISDWQYTEVTSGLSEGEQVIVPQGTTTSPTTQQGPPGGIMIPGMGRPPR